MTMMIWRRRLNVMFIACLIKVYFSLVYWTAPFIAHDQNSAFIWPTSN
jgi:hypothetical protein